MATRVPPIDETKGIILKAKGAAWLAAQEEKFQKQYGNAVPDRSTVLWLIAKQNNLEVADIKADGGSGEGTEILIAEMAEKAKKPEENGWTNMRSTGAGVEFVQPASPAKYSITVCVLDIKEGTTGKGGPKLDFLVTDGSGVAKMVAYADACTLFTEAHVVHGSIIKVPLCNVQYGHHNFGKVKNQVWWKFAVPPFGEVVPLDRDVHEFFLNAETDALKDGAAAYTTAFITHIEEVERDVCSICNRWVTEKKPHDDCAQKDGYDVVQKTFIDGTATSVNGQTYKLSFRSKPKVRIAMDLVEVFGRVNAMNGLDVSFIRKAGTTSAVATEQAPAPAAKPAAPKAAPKKAAPPPPVEEEMLDEERTDNGADEGFDTNEPAAGQVEEPAPQVVVKAATRTPAASKAPAAPAKPAAKAPAPMQAGEEVPEAVVKHVRTFTVNYGGKNRVFAITRPAKKAGLLGELGDDASAEEAAKAKMVGYLEQMAAAKLVEWTSARKDEIKWIGPAA